MLLQHAFGFVVLLVLAFASVVSGSLTLLFRLVAGKMREILMKGVLA